MSTLFSYCIPYDDGAAPNPFWGLCTLAICKPRIRQAANVGDWIVGTGSKNSPIGDISNKVLFAMLVSQKMTMKDYYQFTELELPRKIPKMKSKDLRRHYGDSIYDFSKNPPSLRPSVHNEENRSTDLSGGWVLLSDHFFYFGDRPIALPEELLGIVKQGQGHKSTSNIPYVDEFIRWIRSLGYPPETLIGKPQLWLNSQAPFGACATRRRQEAEADLAESYSPSPSRIYIG
jgi:Nucleotide modification associated domain 2